MTPSVRIGDQTSVRFARVVFTCAGIWGLVVLTPLYFSVDLVGRFYPPTITHPDFFYGFIGVSLAWQLGFLLIGRDPEGLHAMMIPAMLEKFGYVSYPERPLRAGHACRFGQFVVAIPDFVLGMLFIFAFLQVDAARRFPSIVRRVFESLRRLGHRGLFRYIEAAGYRPVNCSVS
jgi:hypothetical protein